jgi:hypothetical protein
MGTASFSSGCLAGFEIRVARAMQIDVPRAKRATMMS